MSRVEKIENQVGELSSFDPSAWDRQFETDVNAGKLDSLAEQALNDHAAGRSREL